MDTQNKHTPHDTHEKENTNMNTEYDNKPISADSLQKSNARALNDQKEQSASSSLIVDVPAHHKKIMDDAIRKLLEDPDFRQIVQSTTDSNTCR